jgi:hypothetical protein
MDKNSLIILASDSKMLRNLSKKLCNYRDIHNDLFQEFLIYLLEKDETYLINKYNDIQFIHYCSNCIRGLNSNRIRDNRALNSKNPLIEKHNIFELEMIEQKDEPYNFDNDIKFSQTMNFIKKNKECDIVLKSMKISLKQIATDSGGTYKQITYKNQQAKQLIRKNIK